MTIFSWEICGRKFIFKIVIYSPFYAVLQQTIDQIPFIVKVLRKPLLFWRGEQISQTFSSTAFLLISLERSKRFLFEQHILPKEKWVINIFYREKSNLRRMIDSFQLLMEVFHFRNLNFYTHVIILSHLRCFLTVVYRLRAADVF